MQEESFESRFDTRLIRTLNDLDIDSYKALMIGLLSKIGMKVTASAVIDDVLFLEGEREGERHLVMASRKHEHASVQGLKALREKAAMEGRSPVLLVSAEMGAEGKEYADRSDVSFADRGKLLQLLKKYELTEQLSKELDRKILAKEGDRFLPSIGKFDALLQAADDAIQHERFNDALDYLERALVYKPEHDLAWRMKATALLGLEQNEKALEAITQSLNIRGTDPWSWYTLGIILNQLGRLEEELVAYDKALKLFPRMDSALLNKASTLFALGRKGEALKVLENLERYRPEDLRVTNNRGIVLKALGRNQEALEAFDSVASRDPTDLDALVNKARLLTQMGSLNEAVDAWYEAVQADRKSAELWFRLGKAQKAAGMMDESARSFGVAATLDPKMGDAAKEREQSLGAAGLLEGVVSSPSEEDRALLGKYLVSSIVLQAMGDLDAALREAERCTAFEPRDPEAFVRKASVLMDLGRIEEAIATLTIAMVEKARSDEVVLDLEALMYRIGRKEEGLKLLATREPTLQMLERKAINELAGGRIESAVEAVTFGEKGDSIAQSLLVLALLRDGRFEEAADQLSTLMQEFACSPQFLNDLGVALRFAGRSEEALTYLHQAVDAEPEYSDAWNNLGSVNYLLGSYDEAERCFREAILIDRRPDYMLNLGMCQLGRNDLEGAEESFTSALQLDQSAEALNGLGVVAERKKDLTHALELYEAALKRVPEFRDAQYNRARIKMLLKGA